MHLMTPVNLLSGVLFAVVSRSTKMADKNANHLMKDDQKGESMEEANLTSNSLELPALPNGKVKEVNGVAMKPDGDESIPDTSVTEVPAASLEEPKLCGEEIQLSTCLVCGKKDRSIEFILPDRYCSQSCADQHGGMVCTPSNSSSEFGDAVPATKSKPTSKSVNGQTTSHRAPGKRKKKKAPYLSAYDDSMRVNGLEDLKAKQKKGKHFKYDEYLAEEKLTAAPEELFIGEPEPSFSNLFTVGMKLEAIDPLHPTAFCVTTVKEVRGHRIRLHFDGYLECYDFWTNAYSDQIFPCGWCEENGKTLQPPKGMTSHAFNWSLYLQVSKSVAAPESLFKVGTAEYKTLKPQFQVGDKLEAVDVKNQSLVCVATVSDVYGDRILVHFDGWEDAYDYWCYYNSLYIHPVGWCQENARILSAPNGYPNPDTFTWDSYTQETNSRPAPREAFQTPLILEFEVGMVLEAIDKRNPILVRVAEVLEVKENRLLIHFCGWDNKYDYWEDVDCPDLHPIGWCSRTGHPLQPPLTPLDIANYSGNCETLGCYGYGHVKGAKYSSHHSLFGCPYSDINMSKDNKLADRLQTAKSTDRKSSSSSAICSGVCVTEGCDGTGHVTGKYPTHFTISGCPMASVNHNKLIKSVSLNDNSNGVKKQRGRKSSRSGFKKRSRRSTGDSDGMSATRALYSDSKRQDEFEFPAKPKKRKLSAAQIMPPPPSKLSAFDMLQDAVYDSVFLPALPANHRADNTSIDWDRNARFLPSCSNIAHAKVPGWNSQQVADFVKSIKPQLSEDHLQKFIAEEIDGEAFLLLEQKDITSRLGIKLGPAILIYNVIRSINKVLGKPTWNMHYK